MMHSSLRSSKNRNIFITNDISSKYFFSSVPENPKTSLQILTQNIYEAHEKLNDLIQNLEEKVKKSLEKQENEFFFAYRSHMSRVQIDLRELKKQIEENEKSNKIKEAEKETEKELKWFKNEAEALSKKLTEKNKEFKRLKENYLMLQSEKLFIENKLIAALSKKPRKNHSFDSKQKKPENEKTTFITEFKLNPPPVTDMRTMRKKLEKSLLEPKDVMYFVTKYQIKDEDEFILDFEEILRQKDKELKKKIEVLALKLENLKKTNIFLNFELNKGLQNTNELKSHLENCFQSIKNRIKKRKTIGILPKIPNEDTQNEVNFQDFKIADKMKLLAYVLSNDSLIELITSKIFPENPQNDENSKQNEIESVKFEENKSFSMPPQEIESLSRDPENLSEKFSKMPQENEKSSFLQENLKEKSNNENKVKQDFKRRFFLNGSFRGNHANEPDTRTPDISSYSKGKYSEEKMQQILKERKKTFNNNKTLTDRINNSFELRNLQSKIGKTKHKKENSFAL